MKKHVRKIFSWILVLCMTFSSLSLNAFAAEPETSAPVSAEEKMQQNSITEESSEEISNTSENTTEVSSDTTEDPTTESTAEAGSDTTEDSTTESTSEAKSGTTQAVKSQSSEISGESTDQTEGETSEAATSEATAEDGTSENGLNALALEDYEASIASLTMGTKPSDGTTTGNPFVKGTAGSNSFRIPAMVTLDNGTIVAAADARWNTTYDGGGLDTIASYSKDSGANWNYTFANYLGDNGNTYNGSGSTAFIDPALATDGETVYMLTDLYPYGVALNGSGNTAPSTSVGFNDDGTLKLAESGSSSYNYYLKDGQIYDSSKNVVSGYTVDAYFNITGDDCDTNLFFSDSPYQVVRTGYLYLTKSTDGGATWSEPTLIPNVKTSSEQVCLVGPGRGLVTNDGTIVFPIYSYNGSSYSQEMGFIYSTDNGATWTRSDSSTSMWSSESAVVELNDGTLRFFFRNGQSSLYYVDYYTSSSHWDTPVDTGIATNSNTQISAIKYSKTVDGKQVILVSCPTGKNSNGSNDSSASARLNGKIFVGYVNTDNTISWQSDKAISVTSNGNQFMYSCLTELSNGQIAILYENCESAWGTGDGYYYTMDFDRYDFPATADSGTEPEPEDSATITDETTGTVVKTSDGTVLTKMDVVANTDVAGLDGRTYVAYDITLNDGEYTGVADVSIKLPDNMKSYTADELTGFTVNNDGSITETKGTLQDGVYTFTAPHFSTQGVVYSVTVNDGTPITIKENETTTISVDLAEGQTVTWSSADNDRVGVAGKYDTSAKAYTNEAILAGQNVTDSPVTVIATIKDADGNVVGTQKWLVTVTAGDADINTTSKGIYFNIDTIEHCTVYYSINGGELIPVNGTGVSTGEWTGNGTYKGHFNIMFFAAPEDGYALTYMSISGSANQYYTLSNGNPDGTGSDAWPFNDAAASTIPSSSSDSAWKTGHGFRWALLQGNMTIDQMKVMFSNAIALGCDGATTITKNEADGMGSASSPTVCKFVAQKLPTVKKTIKSITRGTQTIDYTEGMQVKVDDTINYEVVVTKYATNSTYGTITYDNEKLTDELTNNNGISDPNLETSTTSDKTYPYTTSLKLTYDNFKDVVKDSTITNTAEFSCSYSSQYSAGSLDTKASAVAEIDVQTVNYVVDFGLPLTINLSSYLTKEETTISSGTASYGDITVNGKSFTYTPNTTLKGIDHVTLIFSNGQSYGLNIVPATTVYYEEGFATVSGFTGGSKGIGTQTKSVAGRHTDDKIYHYGYDVKYANELTGASNGTEAVSTTKGSTAEFSFKGTGIDIFANCASDTGNVLIQLSKTDGTPVKLMVVQTAAKGAYGDLVSAGAYNSVIASVKGLTHGDYKVKITTTTADPVKLDGFRVYGTLADEETNAVYTSDLEENPSFFNLRDAVLTDLNANSGTSSASVYAQVYEKLDGKIDGAVVLSNSELNPVDDTETLLNEGPKKEIYLKNNQSLVFKVNTNRKLELGLKAVNDAVTFTINSSSQKINITSDTDMFYEITKTSDGTVTITNNSDAILSVTNLKICDDPNAAFGTLTEDDFNDALVQMGLIDSSESDKTDADKEEDKNIPTKPESGKEDDKNTPSKPESGKETVKKPDKGSSNKTTGVKTPKKVTVKKVASPKKGQMKITWKKVSGASGYEILLATNKAFTKNRKTVVVKGKTKLSKVVKGLKKGRKYYVKVRAYTTAGKKVVKGKYSSRCSVRTKK